MLKWLSAALGFKSEALSAETLSFILEHAKIPEHNPKLMMAISRGKAFYEEDFLGYHHDNWLVFIGYPVAGDFSVHSLGATIDWALKEYPVSSLWLIAPELPTGLADFASLMQSDRYYKLELTDYRLPSELRRIVRKTMASLRVDTTRRYSSAHQQLVQEFLQHHELPPLVASLYQNLPEILKDSPGLFLINAWDQGGNLTAFFAVDQSAKNFDTYVIGCYSRDNYFPHASDRLFWEMIELACKSGKMAIQLGLGVNEGIRRYKEKWGGLPFLDYQAWEIHYGSTSQQGLMSWVSEGKW